MKTCLLILVVLGVAYCLPTDLYKTEWENFKQKFNRAYSAEDDEFRFKIFCKTLDMVTEHNKEYEEGKTSFRMGLNQFSDLTLEEKRNWLGVRHHKEEVESSPVDVYQTEWKKFKDTYKRLYGTPEEEERRFQTFCRNLDEIHLHNELYDLGIVTDKMGVNKFADLTPEEFKEMMGFKPATKTSVQGLSDDYESEWQNFKNTYKRLYETQEEEKSRFQIFCKNLDKINAHNKLYNLGIVTYKMGVNKFADLTPEEIQKMMGFKPTRKTSVQANQIPSDYFESEWENFKARFNRHYDVAEDESHRYEIFSENLSTILKHNEAYEKGLKSYKMAVTMFTDMTQEEYIKWLEEEAGGHTWAQRH